jgi:hypothetical protein
MKNKTKPGSLVCTRVLTLLICLAEMLFHFPYILQKPRSLHNFRDDAGDNMHIWQQDNLN